MKERSTARRINGIVSAFILCLFLAHACIGTIAGLAPLEFSPNLLLRAGTMLVLVHVVACMVTSYEQLTDIVRPPSVQKKRHLVLKWITGALLLCIACFHVVRVNELDLASAIHSPVGTAITIALVAALAWHSWTGTKSLLKDLNIDRKYRNVVRALVSAVALLLAVALALGAMA